MTRNVSEQPLVDAAVVTYRSATEIGPCLSALEASRGVGLGTIAVVDNDSDDATADLVEREFSEVALTRSETNTGFAAATNLAARAGTSEYLLILNPDVTLDPDALARMVELLEGDPGIGIVGCRLSLPDGTEDHAARRSFPTPLSALAHFTGINRHPKATGGMRSYLAPDAANGGTVDAVNGALMLVRRADFERLGGFDEGYWMYMEDLDLCWRFREAGLRTWYEPSVSARHLKGASSGRFRNLRLDWAFHRGMLRFYRTHMAGSHNVLYNSTIYLGVMVKFVASSLRSLLGRALTSHRS